MGGTAKWFLSLQIEQESYDNLPPDIREQFIITKAYRTDIDYSEYKEHVEQKKLTDSKEYKKLKKIEHKINNLKDNK